MKRITSIGAALIVMYLITIFPAYYSISAELPGLPGWFFWILVTGLQAVMAAVISLCAVIIVGILGAL